MQPTVDRRRIQQLRKLAAAKWSVLRITARLRRSPRVVKVRAHLHGIALTGDHAAPTSGAQKYGVPNGTLAAMTDCLPST